MDNSLRTGLYDTVGEYVLLREEPHSRFRGLRTDGSDVDVLALYLFSDRAYRNGALPDDLLVTLVHDVGGFLLANADYFLNVNDALEIEKADDLALRDARHHLMTAVAESIDAGTALRIVKANEQDFKKHARR